jgi:class 3 adenylate cyclase
MRLPFSGKIFLALGGLVCLAIATALGVLEPLSRGRAEADFAARFERARRAFAELQALRKRELADQIALVASHNAQLRTVLSTASLGDDLGFGPPSGADEALRDANLRLRSLIPSLPLAERSDVLVVLAGTGELLWSRNDPERAGDDLSTLEPFRETLARGEAEYSWTVAANPAGGPRLVPERPADAVYLVVAAPVVFEASVHGVVLAGRRVDAEALAGLRAVSGLDLALLSRGALVESTLAPAEADALAAALPGAPDAEQLELAGCGYRARVTPVSAAHGADDARFLLLASTDAEQDFVRRLRGSLLAVGAGVLAGATLAALLLARGITRPVAALARAARRVGAGELDTEVAIGSRDELGELGAAFNEMTRGLRERDRIRRTFERYVSREVASEILRHPELALPVGVKRELTVCFVDVAGFTTLAERLAPEAVVARLNEYLDAVCGAVLAEDGTVNEFLGDGVVAFWGAPVPHADHALRACRAALAARDALRRLAAAWGAAGLAQTRFRIGLHTGLLVVGELGASERRAYRAVGDAMNVAARIEGVNKLYGTELLISETTRTAAGAALVAREVDRVRVVGRGEPLAVFEPVAMGDPDPAQRALLERYAAALAGYRARDFGGAARGFADCLALAPGDGPSAVLLERARAFAERPPPPGWDGVHELASK